MIKRIVLQALAVALAYPGVLVNAAPLGAPNDAVWLNTKDGSVAGVDVNKVDWATFCANVKPVTASRGGVTCHNVYPTSFAVRAYQDLTGSRPNAPPLNCNMEGDFFQKSKAQDTYGDPWSHCRTAFTTALQSRASNRIPYADMSFVEWRKKYFGAWLVSAGK